MCFFTTPRYSDPTYIRYFFYFADEGRKLVADYNAWAQDLGWDAIDESVLRAKLSEVEEAQNKAFSILHCSHSIVCLLHPVKDTLIWQVAYSAGKEFNNPEVGWKAGMELHWDKVKGAYGSTELFVVNVTAKNLRKVARSVYGMVRGLSPQLPLMPQGGEAAGEIGHFCWICGDTFLLLVRDKSKEAVSADFQCATFPRLMMQVHKARHYKRLVSESVEMVIPAVRALASGERRLGMRLIETSLIDIGYMMKNIEIAHQSYSHLVREWMVQSLPGEVWERLGKRIQVSIEDAKYLKEKIEQERDLISRQPAGALPDLDERINALSAQLNRELREEVVAIYRTLRNGNNPVGALIELCRASLKLMDLLFASEGQKRPNAKARPSDNLWDCIVRAGSGDDRSHIQGLHILPDEIASLLHTIRTYANKADHDVEKVRLTQEDAEIGLLLFLRVLKWFYCEYDKGPKLRSIYCSC